MSKMPMPFGNPATYKGHSGIDFAQKRGTPIPASGPGYVLRLSHNAAGGWWTVIRYDNGSTFGYAHQDYRTNAVKPGDRVYEGKIIGHVGSLGKNSTGPHLHLENLNQANEAGVWAWFDRNRVVGQGNPSGGGSVTPPPITPEEEDEEEEMIIIVERANAQLAKGRLLPSGRLREITRSENNLYRKIPSSACLFVQVSDADYANLLAGKK